MGKTKQILLSALFSSINSLLEEFSHQEIISQAKKKDEADTPLGRLARDTSISVSRGSEKPSRSR